jgi:hypothetical protein
MTVQTLLNDPALIVGLIRSALILAVSFGVGITQAQQDSVLMFTGAFLAVLSLALSGVTRAMTTPAAAPVLPQGTEVEVVTPGPQPNEKVTL